MRPRLKLTGVGLAAVTAALAGGPTGRARAEQGQQSIYVGTEACRECHDGGKLGRQYSIWRTTKHSQAYAALWMPESREIARLSGVPGEPQESPLCLGCHSTAADAEGWQLDEQFRPEDGLQCERCHGPGSAHVDAERAGRHSPPEKWTQEEIETLCMICHLEKGSHTAVLDVKKYVLEEAWKTIAHPMRESESPTTQPASRPPAGVATGPTYIGVTACGRCHKGPRRGYQFSRWRQSAHARAHAVLGTAAARKAARGAGVDGDPATAPQCLRCHAPSSGIPDARRAEGFSPADGVQCEVCHGAGEEHAAAPWLGGLAAAEPDEKPGMTCADCHTGECPMDTEPFDRDAAMKQIAHPNVAREVRAAIKYKTPVNLAIAPNGRTLLAACESSDSVIAIDLDSREKVAEIAVGGQPHDVAFSPDGARAYVSCRLIDSVEVIDTAEWESVGRIAVGDEPHGLLTDRTGRWLFVLDTGADRISVVDTRQGREVKRLAAGRLPWSLAMSPDGERIFATSALPHFGAYRTPPESEVSILDVDRTIVVDRPFATGANMCQGVAFHPGGEFALITVMRHKNLIPITRLARGWTITSGLGIVWADGRIDQLLLDEPDMCFPDTADLAISPDGHRAYVTSSGTNRVAVVDVDRLLRIVREASPHEREHVLPNHLGKPTEFVITHVPVGDSPRGLTVAPDGRSVYVANALDDSISVIDTAKHVVTGRIDLGGPKEITKARLGERVFHSADIAFNRQFSCHTCHPDGHVDGLTYDIEADGIGVNPVDNRTLRGILDTAPFKWTGLNPSLQRQCGPRLAVFFTRVDPFTPEHLEALDEYICTIPRPPNRYRVGDELTPAQRRGKVMFERTIDNAGQVIPRLQRCHTCHPAPYHTNRRQFDVGTKMPDDTKGVFDVPHLNNIYGTAPYMHNGIAPTLEEIWTRYNPEDKHGRTNDMTKDQLNDLIEYLKTL